jgi:hypothetical protein
VTRGSRDGMVLLPVQLNTVRSTAVAVCEWLCGSGMKSDSGRVADHHPHPRRRSTRNEGVGGVGRSVTGDDGGEVPTSTDSSTRGPSTTHTRRKPDSTRPADPQQHPTDPQQHSTGQPPTAPDRPQQHSTGRPPTAPDRPQQHSTDPRPHHHLDCARRPTPSTDLRTTPGIVSIEFEFAAFAPPTHGAQLPTDGCSTCP